MANSEFKSVCVIGAGQMGQGIAQVCACAGTKVTLFDLKESALESASKNIEKSITKLISKNKLPESCQDSYKNILFQNKFEELEKHDLVIEAITENESIKKDTFKIDTGNKIKLFNLGVSITRIL